MFVDTVIEDKSLHKPAFLLGLSITVLAFFFAFNFTNTIFVISTGIRCVKVGAYLTQELGFTNVSRLAGGIVAYDRTLSSDKIFSDKTEIKKVLPIIWREHCIECSMPLCYQSCSLYEKRKDDRCLRLEYGIIPYKFKRNKKIDIKYIFLS